jgi:Flp pilus assembly protein TadG
MKRLVGRLANRRGATIVLVALSTAAILAVGAISVDLAMLLKMRGDAQRTADAGALAGASAFLEQPSMLARQEAQDRAFSLVAANYIGSGLASNSIDTSNKVKTVNGSNWTIVSNHATVEIAPAIYRVRVTVRRPIAPTLFARIFGVNGTPIQAYAAAEATNASGARCVKPLGLADTWDEATSDTDGNDFWDNGEEWEYGADDYYEPWDGEEIDEPGDPVETGYGSSHRDDNGPWTRDFGRQMVIKPQNPQVDQVIKPGHFFAWDMPDDPLITSDCAKAGGSGAQDYAHNICECNDAEVYQGQEYEVKPGNMVGPTKQAFNYLTDLDPNAEWVETVDPDGKITGTVKNSDWAEWRDSPRVIKVALFDPAEEYKSGRISITFNNFALMFVEKYDRDQGSNEDAVFARFLEFAEGSSTEGPGGPLAKVLRLME